MTALTITLTCELMFIAHGWLILGHRQKMGADPKDKAQDPLFSRRNELVAFGTVIGVQSMGIYRRVLIAYGAWDTNSSFHQFLDILPLPSNDFTFLLGLALFIGGFTLRVWAIRILGRLFTFEIGIRPEHKIIEEGPYRYIRHPSYTGYALLLVGMGLALSSMFGLLGMLGGTLVFFWLRMDQEETMLLKHFGDEYLSYIKRTKRLIPFIY